MNHGLCAIWKTGGRKRGSQNWIDKETDAENDLGNLGVRAYDDNLGRFTSVDPIWEKFAFMNPYHYSHNSPVIRVDPNGLDDYKIDNVTGKITLIPDTEDKNQDRLFAVDDKGEIEQDNVLILKKGILSKGVKGVDKYGHEFVYYVIKGDDAATKFFEFVAKNSHVEWSQTLLGKAGKNGKNYIATAFDEFQEWGGRHLMQEQFADGWTIREHRHSHPNNTPRPSGSATSVDLYGDIGFARWVKAYADGSSKTVFKIYLPAHEIYMWYKKDGEYEHVKLEDKKE
ncbi:MAG: JAB-like toxin 1 domain-containing protein [Candidatus Kapaibacterium sp.]